MDRSRYRSLPRPAENSHAPQRLLGLLLVLALCLATATAGQGTAPTADSATAASAATPADSPWLANGRMILVHKLFVATYFQLWQNPGLEQAQLAVRAESSMMDWVLVREVLLEIDDEELRFPCDTEKVEIALQDPLNPFVGIDAGSAVCEIPYDVSEDLLDADQIKVGFVVDQRTLDPKRLKPKQLARLRDLAERNARP